MPKPKIFWPRDTLIRQGETVMASSGALNCKKNSALAYRVLKSGHFSNWREFQRVCGVERRPCTDYSREEILQLGRDAMAEDNVIPTKRQNQRLQTLVRNTPYFKSWSVFLQEVGALGRTAQANRTRQALIEEGKGRMTFSGELSSNVHKDLRRRTRMHFPIWGDFREAVGAMKPGEFERARRRNRVFDLRVKEGLNQKQIAERLGLRVNTIRDDLKFLQNSVRPETAEKIRIEGMGQFQPEVPRERAEIMILSAVIKAGGTLNLSRILEITKLPYDQVKQLINHDNFVVLENGKQLVVFAKKGVYKKDLAKKIQELIEIFQRRLQTRTPREELTKKQLSEAIKAYNKAYT